MSNPALNAKLLPAIVTSAGPPPTAAQMLDALYTRLLSATTYRDGSARTPGVGSAVQNVTRYQNGGVTEAVYGDFATITGESVKWIFVGSATTPGTLPPFVAGDTTFIPECLYVGCVKTAGAFTTWNDAVSPFAGGLFGGYAKITIVATGAANPYTSALSTLDIWETQETLLVGGQMPPNNLNGGGKFVFGFTGALVEPFPATAGESDGRLYGVGTAPESTNPANTNTLGQFPNGNTVAPVGGRFVLYNVGLATMTVQIRESFVSNVSTVVLLTQAANGVAWVPLYMKNATNGVLRGIFRNLSFLRNVTAGDGTILPIYDGQTLVGTGLGIGTSLMVMRW